MPLGSDALAFHHEITLVRLNPTEMNRIPGSAVTATARETFFLIGST
jgi:hypothetical protein